MYNKAELTSIAIWFTHSVSLCFVSANTNIITEAIQHTTTAILLTISSPSGNALYSPQVGLQMLVLFSSKKKPSEHCSADVELLSGVGLNNWRFPVSIEGQFCCDNV